MKQHQKPHKSRPCPDIARHAAAIVLWQCLDDAKNLDDVMNQSEEFINLSGLDRGFAANIIKSAIRFNGWIEQVLAAQLAKPLPDTANYARALLRSGLAQYFAKIAPPHAIIDRAVSLAKADRKAFGMANLINAVLRRCFERIDSGEFDALDLLPNLWRTRYVNIYGEEIARKIAQSLTLPPPIYLTLKAALTPEEIAQAKAEFGGEIINGVLKIDALPDGFTDLPSWKSGKLWVQDYSAQLPARLLKFAKGAAVLDMCSAPGGKTMQLCDKGGKVTAVDINDNRLRLVAENLARVGQSAKLAAGDAASFCDDGIWDAILLDAPCSATGTLRRNLEALWLTNPTYLPQIIETQGKLIAAAAKGLKSGGSLLFAICSMEPEEAEVAIAKAQESGLKIDAIKPEEVPNLEEAIDKNGCLRILPFMMGEFGGVDGFFIARFLKP